MRSVSSTRLVKPTWAGIVTCAVVIAAGFAVARLPTDALALLLVVAVAALAMLLARSLLARSGQILDEEQKEPLAVADAEVGDEGPADFRVARVFYYLGVLFLAQLTFRPILPVTLSDWFFLISFFTAAAQIVVRRQRVALPMSTLLVWGVLLFAVGGLISTFESYSPAASTAVVLRVIYLTVVWFSLGAIVLQRREHVRRTIVLWVISAAFSGFGAIIQLLFGDVIPGTDPSFGRMTGFTQHVNDLGGLSAVALVPALVLALRPSKGVFARLFRFLPFALVFAGLILSGSVGGFAAAAAAMFLWFAWSRMSVRTIAILTALAISAGVLYNHQTSEPSATPLERVTRVAGPQNATGATLWSRVEIYRLALRRVQQNPLIGVGLDHPSASIDDLEPHNLLIGTWFKTGIAGLAGMLLILLAVLRAGWPALRIRRPGDDLAGVALLCAFVAFVTFSMSAPILYSRYGWISAALLLALNGIERRMATIETTAPRLGPAALAKLA
jgi:O-antigen ligase